MMLMLHILIALSSIVVASLLLLGPSEGKLKLSYGLILSTLSSGTLLIILNPEYAMRGCLAGLLYTTAVTALTVIARSRLATVLVIKKDK